MQPVDRPFRFTPDFLLVWGLLALPVYFLIRRADMGPWFSEVAAVIVFSLLASFVLYGPVLLARQIVKSGSRGWFVARVILSIFLFAVLLFGGLWISGYYTESRARILGFAFSSFSTAYLHWRLRNESNT